MKRQAWAAATVACCCLGFYLRWLNAHADLESPSIDENDIVQQAVAFMGGEWQYRQFGYGALPMYCLAAIFHVAALLHGLSAFEYAERVFYHGSEHYLLARLFCAACSVPLAMASYRFLAPRFGLGAAALSACLLASPVVDAQTHGWVRVDVAQAACQLGALLCLARTLDSRSWRPWIGAGICAGLGLACKPLPGLLVLPCFLAASWFVAADEAAEAGGTGRWGWLRSQGQRCARALFRPALWGAGVAALVAQILANPTSLELRAFLDAQLETTSFYSGPNAPGAHVTPFEALLNLAWPFCVVAALSVLVLAFAADRRARLISLFPLVYATAFWGRPVRTYYMVAPAMALCLAIGTCLGILLCRWGWDAPAADARAPGAPASSWAALARRGALCLALAAALIWLPASALDGYRRVTDPSTLARRWLHDNVPSGTRLFHLGRYAYGPRLVTSSWQAEAKWADFFDYDRDKYQFYRDAARQAYADYKSQGGLWYVINALEQKPTPPGEGSLRPWVTKSLAQRARANGETYIILAGYRGEHYRELGYAWFDQVELAQQFPGIAIFRVPE